MKDAVTDKVAVSTMVPKEMYEELVARAHDEERTMGVVIRRALSAYLGPQENPFVQISPQVMGEHPARTLRDVVESGDLKP